MILIKDGRLMDPLSNTDEVMDILIEDRKIMRIDKKISTVPEDTVIINAANCVISPGFIDVHSHFRDPGFTYKEDILSGSDSAARGGYTTVVCMANTKPVVDNIETLKYIIEKAKAAKIEVLQTGTVTKGLLGREITDMEGLKNAGAVGFSDDGKPIVNPGVAFDAMKMAKRLNVPISLHEEDPALIYENGINMGAVAEKFGLKGSPHEAEDTLAARDAMLAISTSAKVNIQHISSRLSVEIVRWAKSMGANITAEVTPHHFSLNEDAVLSFLANAKMNPPVRTEADRLSILNGLRDGTIDIIATDHAPHAKEEKEGDFSKAMSGIIGLETAFSLGVTNLVKPGVLTLMELIQKLTVNPAKLYGIDRGYIKEGSIANMVIFKADEEWVVDKFASKSSNSPFTGMKLYGKIKKTIYKGEIVYEG